MDKAATLAALNARIFAARTTFHKVCLRSGVSPTTISRWKANPDMMRGTTLKKLEDALCEIELENNVQKDEAA